MDCAVARLNGTGLLPCGGCEPVRMFQILSKPTSVCGDLHDHARATRTLPIYRNIIRITAEFRDVPLNPLERGALVEEADIQIAVSLDYSAAQEAEDAHAVGKRNADYTTRVLIHPVVERKALGSLKKKCHGICLGNRNECLHRNRIPHPDIPG